MTDLQKLIALLDGWGVRYWMDTGATWVRVVVKQTPSELVMGDRVVVEADVVFEFERDGRYRTMGAYE